VWYTYLSYNAPRYVSMYADRYTTNHFSLTDPNVSDATAILRITQERSAHHHHNLHFAVGHLCSSIPSTGLIAAPHHFLTSGRSPALAIRGHLEASMILSIDDSKHRARPSRSTYA
jgi:hypothetical protein